jgi:hypothetical protein
VGPTRQGDHVIISSFPSSLPSSSLSLSVVRVRVAAPGTACARHLGALATTETTILVPTPLYSSASSHSNPESIAEAEADANADYEEGGALVLPPEVGERRRAGEIDESAAPAPRSHPSQPRSSPTPPPPLPPLSERRLVMLRAHGRPWRGGQGTDSDK